MFANCFVTACSAVPAASPTWTVTWKVALVLPELAIAPEAFHTPLPSLAQTNCESASGAGVPFGAATVGFGTGVALVFVGFGFGVEDPGSEAPPHPVSTRVRATASVRMTTSAEA